MPINSNITEDSKISDMLKADKRSIEDDVALVDACFEQGMSAVEVLREMRIFRGTGIKDSMNLVQRAVLHSTSAATQKHKKISEYWK